LPLNHSTRSPACIAGAGVTLALRREKYRDAYTIPLCRENFEVCDRDFREMPESRGTRTLLDAMNTGHDGALTTIQAGSAHGRTAPLGDPYGPLTRAMDYAER